MEETNNLRWYNEYRAVPDNAKRTIEAGKLKGKTNINAQWRLKSLTELFGPIGFGWKLVTVEHWTSEAAGEICANVRINLFLRDPETKEWSEPIEGIGGSKLCGKGQGDGINDEAWKMATTDAISVACKMLGFGADVYWAEDRTKYDLQQPNDKKSSSDKKAPVVEKIELTEDLYKQYVESAHRGNLCRSGKTAREGFISIFKPDATLLAMFDKDVRNYSA